MKIKLARILAMTTAFSSAIAPTVAKGELLFSKKIPAEQINIMKEDINYLKKLNQGQAQSAAFSQFFETQKIDGKNLEAWLEERVQVVVEDNFLETVEAQILGAFQASKLDTSLMISQEAEIESTLRELNGLNLADPLVYEVLKNDVNGLHSLDREDGHTVMSNIGAAVYYYGKQKNVVIGVKVETENKDFVIPMTSPRSGLIQVGPVLFAKRFMVDPDAPEAAVNKINRLDTYLHEARHSDGNEKNNSLSFMHNNCPDFHDLQGMPACDFSGNGPYAVGGVFSYEYAKSCTDCNESQRAAMLARAYDSFSRVMKVGGKLKKLDPSPEGKRSENQ